MIHLEYDHGDSFCCHFCCRYTVCGIYVDELTKEETEALDVTDNPEEVTCEECK
jgi:hypothetical protein